MRHCQQACAEEQREQRDRTEIHGQWTRFHQICEHARGRMAHLRPRFECVQAPANQVIADMRHARVDARRRGLCFPGELDRAPGHLGLRERAPLRDFFDRMAIAVAAGKVHPRVGTGGIVAQGSLDNTHGFDELAPIQCAQEAQAADAVADRNLVGGLLLVPRLHHLLDGLSRLGQNLLDPGQRQCKGKASPLQPAREFRYEWGRHWRMRARHVRDHQHQAFRIFLSGGRHQFCPAACDIAVYPSGGDTNGNATQVLDQGQPQHDGDGPQLAQLERTDRLVGGDETAETFCVHPAVAVRNDFQRDVIHPRQSSRRAVHQSRQFPAVALGEVAPGSADLLLDQIEVVEQPFAGRRDLLVGFHRCREPAADADQDRFIRRQTRQDLIVRAFLRQRVHGSEPLAPLLHLVGIEQFRA